MEKVKVKLVGEDGNAFAILGRVSKALKRSGQPEAAAEYMERATSGDYNNLLAVTMEYVEEPESDREQLLMTGDMEFEEFDEHGTVGCEECEAQA